MDLLHRGLFQTATFDLEEASVTGRVLVLAGLFRVISGDQDVSDSSRPWEQVLSCRIGHCLGVLITLQIHWLIERSQHAPVPTVPLLVITRGYREQPIANVD